jgi:hypothetical protein
MGEYPRELTGAEISPRLATLVRELATRLLDGPTAEHGILRRQLAAAEIVRVTLTGAGLFAYFALPPDVPLISPREMIGGEVRIEVPGLDVPAGSLLKVSGGKLAFVEVYTLGEQPWPDEPADISFCEVMPLPIPERAI